MNSKGCRTGKGQFPTKQAAQRALRRIRDNPDPTRLYSPTGVAPRCRSCGQYHLTSKSGKRWARGKGGRR